MHEKLQRPSPRFNAFAFSLTALRIWQWASSLFVYVSFGLLYNHIARNRLGDNGRLKNVQVLVRSIYSLVLLHSERVCLSMSHDADRLIGSCVTGVFESRHYLCSCLQDVRPTITVARLCRHVGPWGPDCDGHLLGQDHRPRASWSAR